MLVGPDSLRVLVRFDHDAPLTLPAQRLAGVATGDMALQPTDPGATRARLEAASRLAVRVEQLALDFAFDLRGDTQAAFLLTATSAGIDEGTATLAYSFLTQTLSQAATGHDPEDVAGLFQAMKLPWNDKGRPREAAGLIGGIMTAISRTANQHTAERAGTALFGGAWPSLRPLAQRGLTFYGDLNASAMTQLKWLHDRCPE